MPKSNYIPDYTKYDTVIENIENANDLITRCHDLLLKLDTDKSIMDILAFGESVLKRVLISSHSRN